MMQNSVSIRRTSKRFGALSVSVSSQEDEPTSSSFAQQVSSKSQMLAESEAVNLDLLNCTSPEHKCVE